MCWRCAAPETLQNTQFRRCYIIPGTALDCAFGFIHIHDWQLQCHNESTAIALRQNLMQRVPRVEARELQCRHFLDDVHPVLCSISLPPEACVAQQNFRMHLHLLYNNLLYIYVYIYTVMHFEIQQNFQNFR